jgi:hypothetical protein
MPPDRVQFTKAYDVREVADLTVNGKPCNADIDYAARRIQIDAALDDETKAAAIWHEGLHDILDWSNIAEHDEDAIIALSWGIVWAIQNNPELVRFTQRNAPSSPVGANGRDTEVIDG